MSQGYTGTKKTSADSASGTTAVVAPEVVVRPATLPPQSIEVEAERSATPASPSLDIETPASSPKEFAAWAGVGVQTVYRWIQAGAIRAFKLPATSYGRGERALWRIPASEKQRFMTEGSAAEGTA